MTRRLNALVVGFGSIGQRHAQVLTELGCRVAVTSRQTIDFNPSYPDVESALEGARPDYVVVANRTNEHFRTLEILIERGFGGRVLVEKPLFERPLELPNHSFLGLTVGYNLRCHPLLLRLREFLTRQRDLIAVHVHVGQYLPQWRPDTDYRRSYSARHDQGGGVLRDLSHELDYAAWLFGRWRRMTALGGQLSDLEIDSEDAFSLLMETERCPMVSIHLNYLDRTLRREIHLNTGDHTLHLDLARGTYELDGVADATNVDRNATYRAEHQAMLSGETAHLCNLSEAMETLDTIASAERAASTRGWIER